MSVPKLVIHTDIFIDYLFHEAKEASVLRLAMQKFFCYTTVFHAIELFSLAQSAQEKRAVEQAMSAMKILGLNAKSAKNYGAWVTKSRTMRLMNVLIAGICLESKLPILTGQPKEFSGVKQLNVVSAKTVTKERSSAEILSRARRT